MHRRSTLHKGSWCDAVSPIVQRHIGNFARRRLILHRPTSSVPTCQGDATHSLTGSATRADALKQRNVDQIDTSIEKESTNTVQHHNASTTNPARPTLLQLRNQHHFDIIALAQQAQVHPEGVWRMLLGEPVPRGFAEKVLNAFSEHVGSIYTLETVNVPLARQSGRQ